jgi:hypothetical protein
MAATIRLAKEIGDVRPDHVGQIAHFIYLPPASEQITISFDAFDIQRT